jgi:hypothetical protein
MKSLHGLSLLLIGSLSLTACMASKTVDERPKNNNFQSTGYVPSGDVENFGFFVQKLKDNHYAAVYRGNLQTKVTDASAYVLLAAYDQCAKENKIALVHSPEDYTVSRFSTQVGSISVPLYSGFGSASYSTHVYSYPVSTKQPNFFLKFHCHNRYVNFKQPIELADIKAELLHDMTKDYHGGMLVKSTSSPGKPFLLDDVVIRVAGQRVEDKDDLGSALELVSDGVAPVEVIRNQKIMKLMADVEDQTSVVNKSQEQAIKSLCAGVPKTERIGPFQPDALMPKAAVCRGQVELAGEG